MHSIFSYLYNFNTNTYKIQIQNIKSTPILPVSKCTPCPHISHISSISRDIGGYRPSGAFFIFFLFIYTFCVSRILYYLLFCKHMYSNRCKECHAILIRVIYQSYLIQVKVAATFLRVTIIKSATSHHQINNKLESKSNLHWQIILSVSCWRFGNRSGRN